MRSCDETAQPLLESASDLHGSVAAAGDTDQQPEADNDLVGRRQAQHEPHAGIGGRLQMLLGAGQEPLDRIGAACGAQGQSSARSALPMRSHALIVSDPAHASRLAAERFS